MKNNKSLGQHWLKNRAILDEISELAATGVSSLKWLTQPGLSSANRAGVERRIRACSDSSEATPAGISAGVLSLDEPGSPATEKNLRLSPICLEIGPGLGTLTSSLLRRFPKVIAVEFDENLAKNLPKSFPGKNLEVVHGDILNTDIPALVGTEDYVVVGNIPYYITSPIIRQLIYLDPAPRRIVLLIQKEVAERVAADAGRHSLLSLMTQNRAVATLGPVVRAAEFTPPPKVDSEVLILDPLDAPQISDSIFPFIRQGFSNPRKKLSANLAGHPFSKPDWEEILRREGINPNARAEDLSLWDWETLANLSKTSPES